MQKYNSIKIITDNDLCISCGSCAHICPFENIILEYSSFRGKWDAIVQDSQQCIKCNGEKNCLYVCPSYNTDYTIFGSNENEFLGRVQNVYNGWSNSNNIRFKSSSGGFIRELSKNLLDRKLITNIISISHDKGLEYTPKSITDIEIMPNSIYHNINYEQAFDIIKKEDGKFLIIGLPCQLMGIELLLMKKKYAFLKEKVYLKVALICGYTFDRVNLNFFESINNFEIDEVIYRENGRYRKTKILNEKESLIFDLKKPSNINEIINNHMMFDNLIPQKNCLYCVNHLGYNADIVVGDAWQNRYSNDNIGTNIIITRTIKGDKIVENLDNFILEEGKLSEIIESQGVYSQPFLGLSFSKENLFKDNFISKNIVGEIPKEKYIKFSIKDKIKIIYLKKMFRKKYFKCAKIIYIFLEIRMILKLIVKKIIGRKYQ